MTEQNDERMMQYLQKQGVKNFEQDLIKTYQTITRKLLVEKVVEHRQYLWSHSVFTEKEIRDFYLNEKMIILLDDAAFLGYNIGGEEGSELLEMALDCRHATSLSNGEGEPDGRV